MTVAELRYALREMDDDAEVLVLDGEQEFAFGPGAVSQGALGGRPVVMIDLTSTDCEARD